MMDDAELVRQLREPAFERGLDEKWIDAQRNCAADRIEALISECDKARARAASAFEMAAGLVDTSVSYSIRALITDQERDALDRVKAEAMRKAATYCSDKAARRLINSVADEIEEGEA